MAKIDYVEILKAAGVAALTEKEEPKAAAAFKAADAANGLLGLLKGIDPALLMTLISLIAGLFAKKDEAPKGEEPKPSPLPVPEPTPKPTPSPAPTPAPPAPTGARRVARVTLSYFWITEDGKLKNAAEFKDILNRQTPLREGARVCLNATPWDQFGKELKPEAYEPLAWKADGTPRMRYYGNNPDVTSITGGEHSLGCTPVLKCDRQTLDDDQTAETGETNAVWEGDDDEVESASLSSLIVKGEKNR